MNTQFMKKLVLDLEKPIQNLLDHPFLSALIAGRLSIPQIREFAIQYYFYCSTFPRMLAAVASNVLDDETRLNLIENLWEEHGEGNLSKSHRSLYKHFLKGLNIVDNDLDAALCPYISHYLNECMYLCRNAHFLEGLAFLGPGAEMFTAKEYSLILKGLHQYSDIPKSSLEFWVVHLDADEEHYIAIASALERWTLSPENVNHIRNGAAKAISMEYLFWTKIQNKAGV